MTCPSANSSPSPLRLPMIHLKRRPDHVTSLLTALLRFLALGSSTRLRVEFMKPFLTWFQAGLPFPWPARAHGSHPSLYSIWPLCPTLPIRQLSVLKMFPSPSHFFSSKLLIIFLDGLFWFMSAFPLAYLLPPSIFKYMLLVSWWDDDNKNNGNFCSLPLCPAGLGPTVPLSPMAFHDG